ncbi:MAG: hypothetical protein GX149_04565 [Acholeplasmataceae bacterium]|nr:hypothetical protein [Acholeplasmataceae bacterium]
MRCYICGRSVFKKRTIKTLFTTILTFRCYACKLKYPTFQIEQVIPKHLGLFYLTSLFKEDNKFNLLAFNTEISKWFLRTLEKKQPEDLILWLDKIDLKIIELLDFIAKDIYILSKTILTI